MSDNKKAQSAEVVQLRQPLKATRASEQKWGKAVMGLGFCIVPSLLLRAQQRLKLTPTQLAILMHLADYWWDVGRKPFPTKKTLEKTVERLRENSLLVIEQEEGYHVQDPSFNNILLRLNP